MEFDSILCFDRDTRILRGNSGRPGMHALRSFLLLFFAFGAFLLGTRGSAQTTTGSVFGTVTDISGAVVPNAAVSLTNVQTGQVLSAASNASGNYIFPVVNPGSYIASSTVAGFKTETQRGIQLAANQNVHVNFSLGIGSSSQTVNVTAATTLVDTRESQLGETVDQQRIAQLPLNGRDASQLVQLVPGVTGYVGGSNIGNQNGTTFAVNGIRADQNTFYLDGAFDTAFYRNGGNRIPNPDALEEFRLLTSNYDAEFGRNPGGVVNMITRSGTNRYHGLLYDYVRDDALNAKSYFNSIVTPLVRNQFGGTFGGPIRRNKTFFFLSYEGLKINTTDIIAGSSLVTPTAGEAKGDFRGDVGKKNVKLPNVSCNGVKYVICPAQLDPVAQNMLKFVPLSDPFTGHPPDQSAPAPNTANEGLARIDDQLTDSHKLSTTFFMSRGDATMPSGGLNRILDYSGITNYDNQVNGVVSDTWIVSPKAVNSLRLFYTLNHFIISNLFKNNTWADLGSQIHQGAYPASQPEATITGYWNMGVGPGATDNESQQSLGIFDTLDLTRGNHSIKLGGSFVWAKFAETGAYQGTGSMTFTGTATGNALADFLEGKATSFIQNSGAYHRLHGYDPALFAQDDWKATKNLTLDLGLRWELYPPFTGQNNDGTFDPGVQSKRFPTAPLGLLTSGDPGIHDGILSTSYTKFAPRVGFAYDLFGNGRTAIRGAYGIFYATVQESLWENLEQQPFTLSVTTNQTPSMVDPYAPGPQPFPYVVNPQNPTFTSGATIFGIPKGKSEIPYVQQYSLGIQQQFGTQWSGQLEYVGNTSRKLSVVHDVNQPTYIPGASTSTAGLNSRRPYQPTPKGYVFSQIELTDPAANASYNSLQVSVQRRFAHRFSLLASYVWSKAIDIQDTTEGSYALITDQSNIARDRGPAAYEVPQLFVASYLYALPRVKRFGIVGKELLSGWQLNGVTTIESGSPFNVTSGVDSNLNGINNDRPNQVGNPVISGRRSTAQKVPEYFDTAAFVQVPAGVPYGNVRKNSLMGPGSVNTDLSAFKNFPIWKQSTLQFRGELFNAFNNVNLNNPNGNLKSPLFGSIAGSAPPRIVQFAVRYSF